MVRDLNLEGNLCESALKIGARSSLGRRSQARSPQAGAAMHVTRVLHYWEMTTGVQRQQGRGEERTAWSMMAS